MLRLDIIVQIEKNDIQNRALNPQIIYLGISK